MLLSFTKTLCPLISLSLLFSCGKKATDDSADVAPVQNVQNQTGPVSLDIDMTGERLTYVIPTNGHTMIPTTLKWVAGPGYKKINITFNKNPQDPTDYEAKCSYFSTGAGVDFVANRCSNNMNQNLGQQIYENPFVFDHGRTIEIEYLGPTPAAASTKITFIVKWL